MTIIHSLVLGAVQGLTEFLPISSSGHLIIVPYLLKWTNQSLAFDVALHMGTALALLAYFWRDWLDIFKKAFAGKNAANINPEVQAYPNNLLWQILVATIPAGIFGLLLDKYLEKHVTSVIFVAINLIVFGLILWLVDKKAKSDFQPSKITYGRTFLIGLSQAIALIPGVSRSGITITASRLAGLKREEAAKFSFLLATPTIVGAFLYKLPGITSEPVELSFWLGVLTATVFGFLAIKYLLNFLKKSDFSLFLWYRIIIALLVITVFLLRR